MKYCSSCGSPIPEGQGSSCSMCYGDIAYGSDRYYEEWALQQLADQDNRQREDANAEEQVDDK